MNLSSTLSVVIPAFNCARYLPTALVSIQAPAGIAIEIIVVDDGSTDNTRAVMTAFPGVTYLHRTQGGIGAARNTGIAAASGTFLAFLDADDFWAPHKIARQLEYLSTEGTDMVFGHVQEFVSEDVSPDDPVPLPAPAQAARVAGTLLTTRAAFNRVGDFRTEWRVGEFIDWNMRAVDLGLTHGVLPDVVLHRRLHATNTGRVQRHRRGDYVHILKQGLDRRRAMRDRA